MSLLGMFEFFEEFEITWRDYYLAGGQTLHDVVVVVVVDAMDVVRRKFLLSYFLHKCLGAPLPYSIGQLTVAYSTMTTAAAADSSVMTLLSVIGAVYVMKFAIGVSRIIRSFVRCDLIQEDSL